MDISLHKNTPTVTVLDCRGLTIRELAYHRHPDTPESTETRITYHQFDARGILTQSIDQRLTERQKTDGSVQPNFMYLSSLSGEVLCTESVDAGTNITLHDIAGRPLWSITAAGTDTEVTRHWQYENAQLPGRLLSISEQAKGKDARMTERFVWAENSQAKKNFNLAGQCVRHYDTAGLNQINGISLTGIPLFVTRKLLSEDTEADWKIDDKSTCNTLRKTESYTTKRAVNALGDTLTTTDAAGHCQRVAYDVAGLLKSSWLTLKKEKGQAKEQVIVKSLTYSAAGQKLREEHGNGVVTTYTYEPKTQRLSGIKTERPAGHTAGAKVLQDLRYIYDPVGNVLRITNDTEATRYWRNQEIVPENTYTYDSLYQLVSATGREMAGIAAQGTERPDSILLTSDNAYTNYTRHYHYDRGGNLTQICHKAPASNNCYTTNFTVSNRSNRSVLSTLTKDITKVDVLFDGSGHQKQMQSGQHLVWTPRGELQKVTLVTRKGGKNDSENYRYDAGSQRVLKVNIQQTGNITQKQRVVYLPGLELRTTTSGNTKTESLQVITIGEAGRAQVRILHWAETTRNDQIRYSYDNLIGSSGLEIDGNGLVLSQEEYYPYGGTSVWKVHSQTEADYKTHRYSGKERDATGLYYYGYRYYQPWAGRWLSADPAGTVDGLNLFCMVRNNPITYQDIAGLASTKRKNDSPTQQGAAKRIKNDPKGLGTYASRVKERTRLTEKYYKKKHDAMFKKPGRHESHQSEHVFGYAAVTTLKRGSDKLARTLEGELPAYYEEHDSHRAHIGTGSNNKGNNTDTSADLYRELQGAYYKNGEYGAGIQLNQTLYSNSKNNQYRNSRNNPMNVVEHQVADDSFRNMIKHTNVLPHIDNQGSITNDLMPEPDKIESITARLMVEQGRNPTYSELTKGINDVGLFSQLFKYGEKLKWMFKAEIKDIDGFSGFRLPRSRYSEAPW